MNLLYQKLDPNPKAIYKKFVCLRGIFTDMKMDVFANRKEMLNFCSKRLAWDCISFQEKLYKYRKIVSPSKKNTLYPIPC